MKEKLQFRYLLGSLCAFMDPQQRTGSNYVKRIKIKNVLRSQDFTSCFMLYRQSSGSVCRSGIINLLSSLLSGFKFFEN